MNDYSHLLDLRSDETKAADDRVAKARADERERCAKIVEGEPYAERYRKWPQVSAEGNRSNDCEITKHCAALAAVIRGVG